MDSRQTGTENYIIQPYLPLRSGNSFSEPSFISAMYVGLTWVSNLGRNARLKQSILRVTLTVNQTCNKMFVKLAMWK